MHTSSILSTLAIVAGASASFDPYSYTKTSVQCKAVDRSGATPEDITLNLKYIDVNPTAKKVLVLTHGWPSMWTTWRNQIEHFGSDYRLIIPELRGYGESEHPIDVRSSNTFFDVANDLLCMLDNAGVEAGVCVGHDYGAQVCWEAGRVRPDRFIGVAVGVVPYVSSALGFIPTEGLAALNPRFGYQVFFNDVDAAAEELNSDIRGVIRTTHQFANADIPEDFLIPNTTFLGPWYTFDAQHNYSEIPASGLLPANVEDYMVEMYSKQGFAPTVQGYQNPNRNLTVIFDQSQGNYTLNQPTLSIYPALDIVADWADLAIQFDSNEFLTNAYNASLPAAHFLHEELPDQFNALIEEWIGNVTWPSS